MTHIKRRHVSALNEYRKTYHLDEDVTDSDSIDLKRNKRRGPHSRRLAQAQKLALVAN